MSDTLHPSAVDADAAGALERANVLAVTLLGSAGAGKTSVIARTVQALAGRLRVGVVESAAATAVDRRRVQQAGAVDVVQSGAGDTGRGAADALPTALDRLDLQAIDLLLIEHDGGLVWPAPWAHDPAVRVVIASVADGDDKPLKYAATFEQCDAVVLTKIDLRPYVDFELGRFYDGVRACNPSANLFELDCRHNRGFDDWAVFLLGLYANGLPRHANAYLAPALDVARG